MIPKLHEAMGRHILVHVQVVSLNGTSHGRVCRVAILAEGLPSGNLLRRRIFEEVMAGFDILPVMEHRDKFGLVHDGILIVSLIVELGISEEARVRRVAPSQLASVRAEEGDGDGEDDRYAEVGFHL